MLDYFGDFDKKYAEFVRKFEDTRSTVVCTLMLLEELGGAYLPMGRRVPHEMRYVLCPLSLSLSTVIIPQVKSCILLPIPLPNILNLNIYISEYLNI